MEKIGTRVEIRKNPGSDDSAVLELQRLVLCYQEASTDDKNVIWSVLNKYANKIDGM